MFMHALIRLFGILALVFAAMAGAVAEVSVPALKARVTDLTGTLASAQVATLEAELRAFEQRKGSQIAVLMLSSTQPETIEQYSIRVAERWKIGRARVDDGVILVIAKNDQRLRLEVGYGLEGAIPDVVAKRLIREVIAPHFLANDFYGGISDGARTLMKLIDGEKLPPPAHSISSTAGTSTNSEDYQSIIAVLLVVAVVAGGILKAIFGRLFGSALTGVAAGIVAWLLAGAIGMAAIAGVLAFLVALLGIGRGVLPGGFGGGGGGGFGGGGGGFGGGGASGSWGNR